MDLLGISCGGAVDTGVVDAFEHEHLVVGFAAEVADLTDVHF